MIAPGADADAIGSLRQKKNLRLLTTDGLADPQRRLDGAPGFGRLSGAGQGRGPYHLDDLKVVTKRAPTEQELSDLLFAWTVAKHVKSNAIIYVKDGATVGVGAGQMSRVDSTRIAARKAQDMAEAMGLPAPLTKGPSWPRMRSFPLPMVDHGGRGGCDCADPARRLDARRRGDCRRRCGWSGDGLYRHASFPALGRVMRSSSGPPLPPF